jgi:hypothetical protein
MPAVADYLALVTSEHATKPRFMATIGALVEPLAGEQIVAAGLPADFDLDAATGAQLDVVGQWVGIARRLPAPLQNVYFSFDDVWLGFDQGSWKGPFDPENGLITLDDGTYRILLRVKIAANNWDGTFGKIAGILAPLFSPMLVIVEDNQDMSMIVALAGGGLPAVLMILFLSGQLGFKPAAVRVVRLITSELGSPLFGFDASSSSVAGFDVGAWGVGSIPHDAGSLLDSSFYLDRSLLA